MTGHAGWPVRDQRIPAAYQGRHRADDDPPRCWSCGHPFDAGCECSCCQDGHDGGPDDV